MSTAVRSSKCSSATKPGDPTPVDLNAAGSNGLGVGFTSRVERADVFAGVSSVVDLLAPALQPSAGGVGSVTIASGGSGYTAGVTTGSIVGGSGSGGTFKVTATGAGGTATAVEITAFGSGYTPGSSVTLVGGSGTHATGTLHSPLHGKKVTLEVFLSPVDCTDLNNFPNESNAVKGGGLVPTIDQLSKHFHKQFVNPVSLTYSDTLDRRQSIAVCVVSQTYLCVQASVQPQTPGTRYNTSSNPSVPTDTFQILARVESYLFPNSIPLLDSDNGNVNSAGATEGTLSAVKDSIDLVSGCVTSQVLKVDVQNAASDAHSVELVNGGAAVSGSNPLAVDGRVSLDANHNIYPVARDAGGAARGILVDTNNRIQADVTGVGQALASNPGGYTTKVLLADDQGRLLIAPQAFTVAPVIATSFLPSTANPTFDLSFRPDSTNHPTYRLVARRARFCLTWFPLTQPSPSSSPTDDASKTFLLSMSDDNSSWNGLVRYRIDPTEDRFFDGAGQRYYSINMDLGRCVPRYLSIQNLDASGTGMLNATCRIFCEA